MAARNLPGLATLLLALALALPVRAGEAEVVDKWYAALLLADRPTLDGLLADDARIRLDDIDLVQTKAEFLASMDEWKAAVAGATIRHRIDASEAGVATVTVCYDFPGNELLTRETFAIDGERITASSQATVAESCAGY